MKRLISLLFLLVSFSSFAQDAVINLQEFVLEVPTVNKLTLRPVGAKSMEFILPDTINKQLVQKVYYQLKRKDGRTVEEGNWTLPSAVYDLTNKYIQKNVTASDVSFINQFLTAAGLVNLHAILPPIEEEE